MSLSALESTVNTAFDARDRISTATKGEVREAVDHALELLDKGEARAAVARDASRTTSSTTSRHTPRMRGIKYAAAFRLHYYGLWNTGSPAFAGDDGRGCGAGVD